MCLFFFMFSKLKGIKSQVSMEYVMIVGFGLLIILPIIVLSTSYAQDYSYKFKSFQAQKALDVFSSISDELYFEGYPSKRTVKVFIPDNIVSSYSVNNAVFFELRGKDGIVKVYSVSKYANMSFENISSFGYLTFELFHAVNDTIIIRKV